MSSAKLCVKCKFHVSVILFNTVLTLR